MFPKKIPVESRTFPNVLRGPSAKGPWWRYPSIAWRRESPDAADFSRFLSTIGYSVGTHDPQSSSMSLSNLPCVISLCTVVISVLKFLSAHTHIKTKIIVCAYTLECLNIIMLSNRKISY